MTTAEVPVVSTGVTCSTLAAGDTDVVVAGVGGVPLSGVAAVTVSVVAYGSSVGGRLRAAPNGDASAGDISWDAAFASAAGVFTVPVNGDGTITIETDVATDAMVSVSGYWKVPSGSDTGLGLHVADGAQRLVDTTAGVGTCDGDPCGRFANGSAVQIDVAGQAGVPANAAAVMVALNLVDPSAAGLVTVGPSASAASGVLVFEAGAAVQASMIVELSDTGSITVLSTSATDVSVDVVGWFTMPTNTYSYEYGSGGLRSAKELEGPSGWRHEYSWSAGGGLPLLLAEHHANATSYLVYGPGGTPIYQVTRDNQVIYYHQDHQGSTRLTTTTNGTVRGAVNYDAHGDVTSNTQNPWIEQALLGYTGQYHDTETGYIYLRARHYDPTTGQFTSLDPLVAVTEEPYGYTTGNPANETDPSGLCGETASQGSGKEDACDDWLDQINDLLNRDKRLGNGGTHGLKHRYRDFFSHGVKWLKAGKPWRTHQQEWTKSQRAVRTRFGKLRNPRNKCGPPGPSEVLLTIQAEYWLNIEAPTPDQVISATFGDSWYDRIPWEDIAKGAGWAAAAAAAVVMTSGEEVIGA